MQFNHPEVLYALLFLIIPVIVHLFQLRKFKKESFTNVKFLKKISRQTRKSSKLKKWLVLATRLLLLTCIILAFAQPYFPSEETDTATTETYIYLDNSYSMEATGRRGRLLNRSVQELLEKMPQEGDFTLLTNDEEFPAVSREDLQAIGFSGNVMDPETVFLRAQSRFSRNPDHKKQLLYISDFQDPIEVPSELTEAGVEIFALPVKAENRNNISLDSIYLAGNLDSRKLIVSLGYSGNKPGNVPVSLYAGERLIGKSSIDFEEDDSGLLEFPIEEDVITAGRVEIEDNGLLFDNSLFFSLNPIAPINVSSINAAEDRFLSRIYQSPEFEYAPMTINEIDYNTLQASGVIILNEVEDLPPSLLATFIEKSAEGTIFIIVPGEEAGAGLQSFLSNLGFPNLEEKIIREQLITEISFQHPLFSEVFEEQISNFEYPKVQSSYRINFTNPLLSFANGSPYLIGSGSHYLFTAPLNNENSNFSQSPLIVPVFYNMGTTALKPSQLYYLLGESNRIEVPVELQQDRILEIRSEEKSFIPQQQSFSRKVEIITEDLPEQPGNYTVINNEEEVMGISYNIPGWESKSSGFDIDNAGQIEVVSDLEEFFTIAGFNREENSLWKWFVTFALLFLIIETLLLKYFK